MAFRTWNGGIGYYGDAGNWTPTGVPQPGELAAVTAGTVLVGGLDISDVTLGVGGTNAASEPVVRAHGATFGHVELLVPFGTSPHALGYGRLELSGINTIADGVSVDGQPAGTLTIDVADRSLLTLEGASTVGGGSPALGESVLQVTGVSALGVANNGTVTVSGGILDVAPRLGGMGHILIAHQLGEPPSTSTVELGSTVGMGQTIDLTADLLKLDAPKLFNGTIDQFGSAATIDLVGTTVTGEHFANGVLNLTDDGATVARLHFAGDYTTADFAVTGSGGDTLITLASGPACMADAPGAGEMLAPAHV